MRGSISRRIQYLLAAIILIIVTIPYARSEYWKVYGSLILSYPLLAACGGLIYMAILGIGGPMRDYGISNLFWSDRWWRQVFAGTGAVLLFIEIFVLCYYFDTNKNNTNKLTLKIIDSITWSPVQHWAKPLRSYTPTAGGGGIPDVAAFANNNNSKIRAFLYVAGLPVLVTLALPAILPAIRLRVPVTTGTSGGQIYPGWILGIILGVLVVWLINITMIDHYAIERLSRYYPLSQIVDWMSLKLPDPGLGLGEIKVTDGFMKPLRREYCISIVNTLCQTALFFSVSIAFYGKGPPPRGVTPAFALCMTLGFVCAIYALIAFLAQGYQIFAYLGIIGILVLTNSGDYKLRFPGMNHYYGETFDRKIVDLASYDKKDSEDGQRSLADEYCLLKSKVVLKAWREGFSNSGEESGEEPKIGEANADQLETFNLELCGLTENYLNLDNPKLVVVSVTGGAIRSAIWVAVVLAELEKELTTRGKAIKRDGIPLAFSRHVRLLTGASGGMVGAAYYLTALKNGHPTTDLVGQMTTDSLMPVASRLVSRDIPAIFSPFDQTYDRGQALEDTWNLRSIASGLPLTFQDLSPLESSGQIPSAIYSPIMVEDGRRLLISNLDLDELVHSKGNSLLDVATRDRYGDVYSKSAVEFFRLFPLAKDFRLGTAARMNATFPFISPMLSLPTHPPRRIADAGYYDNYGVNLAIAWIDRYRESLIELTSGVVLIQIRDGMSEQSRHELVIPGDILPRRNTSLNFLSSPLQALFAAWRSMSSYRNDEQVQATSDWFDRNVSPGFFTTVVFESPAQVPMNWYMTQSEKENLMFGMGESNGIRRIVSERVASPNRDYVQNNIDRIDQLMNWW